MALSLARFISKIVALFKGPVLAAVLTVLIYPFYLSLASKWKYGDHLFFVLMTSVIHAIFYFGLNTIFMIVESKGWLLQYKIDRLPVQIPSKELIVKTVSKGIINQLSTQPLSAYLIYYLFIYFGTCSATAPLPSFQTLILHFIAGMLFNEFAFYFSHRMFHESKFLYGRFHKQHHEYTGSIGFAAEYAHPVEAILSNSLPSVLGVCFCGCHPLVWFVWLSWRLEQTYESHSGYSLKIPIFYTIFGLGNADNALHHDAHHSKNTGNYGSVFLDELLGTNIIMNKKVNNTANVHPKKTTEDNKEKKEE